MPVVPRTVTGRGFGGQSNQPPSLPDPPQHDLEITDAELRQMLDDLEDVLGPENFLHLVLGLDAEALRSRRRAIV